MGKITQKRRGRKGEWTPLSVARFVGGVDMKTPGCCLTWCLDQTVDICMAFWQCEGKVGRNYQPHLIPGLGWWGPSTNGQMLWRNVLMISMPSGFKAATLTPEYTKEQESLCRKWRWGRLYLSGLWDQKSSRKYTEKWLSVKCIRNPLDFGDTTGTENPPNKPCCEPGYRNHGSTID